MQRKRFGFKDHAMDAQSLIEELAPWNHGNDARKKKHMKHKSQGSLKEELKSPPELIKPKCEYD